MNAPVPTASRRKLDGARRFAALVRKESFQIVRDPSSILIAFVLPLILLFLFGYGVSLDTQQTRVGLRYRGDDAADRWACGKFQGIALFRRRRRARPPAVRGRPDARPAARHYRHSLEFHG